MSRATYLYCVTAAARKPVAGRMPPGLPGADLPAITDVDRGLWMVTAHVPLEVYGPGPLEAALKDLDWVSSVALAHESVVEHFARKKDITVVPMKLFTMFSSDDRARREMLESRVTIADAVKRIKGCEEWGVRIIRKADSPVRSGEGKTITSGTAFLAARKEARDAARDRQRQASDAADSAFLRLGKLARDARRRNDVPAGGTPPLLDAAFLVPASKRDTFKSSARRLASACAEAGADMTLTGPWPAYNFVAPA